MTRSCCVINCNSRSHDHRRRRITPDIHFYRFPAWKRNSTSHVSDVTKRRRMAWIAAVRRPNITFDHTPPHMEVCSKHFHKGKPAYEMLECDPDWARSLNLGHSEVKAAGTDRFERLGRRVTRCQEEAVTGEKESAEQASNSLPPPPDNTSHDADDVTPLYYSVILNPPARLLVPRPACTIVLPVPDPRLPDYLPAAEPPACLTTRLLPSPPPVRRPACCRAPRLSDYPPAAEPPACPTTRLLPSPPPVRLPACCRAPRLPDYPPAAEPPACLTTRLLPSPPPA
ncbi:hypothetical protein N1851_030983 [Merluccius polli]|uniref:THAP-type domain-containing protein n=1 Tax=Merluccius polli TaxID=89951 RepID=A0AA47M4I0_MERPO|nr:hypothetical protein N1851_030983 [Merluccius polli]